jgi:hypothetical protein
MDIRSIEPELRSLMLAGLDGDATGCKALFDKAERPSARLHQKA